MITEKETNNRFIIYRYISLLPSDTSTVIAAIVRRAARVFLSGLRYSAGGAATSEPVETTKCALYIDSDKVSCFQVENIIYLFQCAAFRLRHKQQLIEKTTDSNTTIKANHQSYIGHAFLHSVEVVGDNKVPKIE